MYKADLISVIVPIYNSDQYISGCVDSVLMQTYTYFELLLIDDGSTDHSRDICEGKCLLDERVRLIIQRHTGVSAARNAGIKASRGQYLFFLDADDMIHPKLLETLYQLLKKSKAVIATESRYYASGGSFRKPDEWKNESGCAEANTYMDSEKAIEALIYADKDATLYVIGGKLIGREAVKSVQFDERLTHGEDTLFLYRLLENGADVVVLHRNWYYYRMYEGSATKIFSVSTCQSRYEAEKYIRMQEIKSRRTSNAIHWEEAVVRAMMAWYETGRRRKDAGLSSYVKSLAESEKKLYIFSKIARYERVKFYLVFYCYPYYRVMSMLFTKIPVCPRMREWLWRILHRKSERARRKHG